MVRRTVTHVSPFLGAVGDDYYFHELTIRQAVARKTCFNLVHLSTSFKVDVFVSKGRAFDRDALARAANLKLGEGGGIVVPIATPEDMILAKLSWYREGDEVSERQWDDVTRLMKLKKTTLDLPYLQRHAAGLKVSDLLRRLCGQTGIEWN